MKVWLNDLKEGDIFYYIVFNNVYKCKHLGDAHNMNFRMSRIKFEIINEENTTLKDIFDKEQETFVNQYVYDDYNSALEALKEKLQNDYDITIKSIILKKQELENLEEEAINLKKIIKYYAEQNLEKN